MKISKILLSTAISITLLSSCASNTKQYDFDKKSTQSSKSEFNYDYFTLDNGLKVYLTRNTETPRFRAEIAVDSGSKQDPQDATGIAHYLEHMLFKGTENMGTSDFAKEKVLLDEINKLYDIRFNEKDESKRLELLKKINKLAVEASKYSIPNELDAIYSKLGAQGLNAYTDAEETVYVVDLPKNRMEQWAMIESERFAKPVFRLFQSELETVYEEKNRSMDNKERIIGEAVEQLLYKKHPYGTQTTLGTVEHLKNPSLTKMYEFYRKNYVPNNMAIIISGDIDIPETKKIITKYFSSWKKGDDVKFEVPKEEPINGIERKTVNYKGEEKLVLAFRGAKYSDKDKDALTLIDMILDNGEAGLINQNLVNVQKVRAAGSYTNANEDYGSMYLYGIPKQGQSLKELEDLLLEQVNKIKKGEFDESLLSGIILAFEIGQKARLESNDGRVDILKTAFLRETTVNEILGVSERLKKISKDDIIKAANKYYQNNYVAVYRTDKEYTFPKIEKPNLEKVALNNDRKSDFIKKVESIKTEPIEPKWIDYNKDFKAISYAPGTVLYHTYNPLNDLFNFYISYDYGNKHYRGFCEVMDELNFAGTGKMTPEQIKEEFFKMGVNANYSCGDYGFTFSMSGTDSQFEKALALGEKVLWSATLDENHLKNKVSNILTSRIDAKKDHNTLRRALSSYIGLGKKSSYLERLSKEELEKLSVNQYDDMRKQLIKQNFEVSYSGQLPVDIVEKTVKKYHQPQNINVPLLNPRQRPEKEFVIRHNKPVKIYFLDNKGAQAHISLLIPESKVNVNDNLKTALYNEYFDGGMGGIMFQEVREARSLAYSTSAYYSQGSRLGDQDQMTGYIGTQADKTIESLTLFIDLLKNLPVSKDRFERARDAIENSYRTGYVDFRSIVGTVMYWGKLGYDKDPRPEDFEKLSKVEFDEMLKYVKEKVSNNNLTFMVVGDKSKIKMEDLKKLGDLEEVSINNLFTD
ncbi:MAG: insulinase family protein [Candidatus Sericytochromatia bacterium]